MKTTPTRLLLIVNPQNDFISGELAVPGAVAAMTALTDFLRVRRDYYSLCVITADWHPANHCSFRSQGGTWPMHCVQHSGGAAIFAPLLKAVCEDYGTPIVLRKGDDPTREELSLFRNEGATRRLDDIVESHGVTHIDICGLSGDVRVLHTLRDAQQHYPHITFDVDLAFTASFDGGKAMDKVFAELHSQSDNIFM